MQAVGAFYQQTAQKSHYQGYKKDMNPNEIETLFEGLLEISENTLDNKVHVTDIDVIQESIAMLEDDEGHLEQSLVLENVNSILKELLLDSNLQKKEVLELFMGNLPFDELSNEKQEYLKNLKELLIPHQDNKQYYETSELLARFQDTEKELLINLLEKFQKNDVPMFSVQSIQSNFPILQSVVIKDESYNQQVNRLVTQVETILMNVINDKGVIREEAPRLLKLLEEWTTLQKKLTAESIQQSASSNIDKSESKEHRLWKDLLIAFQKRNQLASKQQYNMDAKVTSKDIEKWINNGLFQQAKLDSMNGTQQINLNRTPITNLEQYVIHINQTGGSQKIDKQLMDQFKSILKSNRFLSMNNGINQLTISLRPDNLGVMKLRLTQINGEMTLKIIVSSQATRQMLESNIHQLKNMFSPNQVVIEEQEVDIQNIKEETEKDSMADQDEGHPYQSHEEDSDDPDGDFETMFQEIILNEKV